LVNTRSLPPTSVGPPQVLWPAKSFMAQGLELALVPLMVRSFRVLPPMAAVVKRASWVVRSARL